MFLQNVPRQFHTFNGPMFLGLPTLRLDGAFGKAKKEAKYNII